MRITVLGLVALAACDIPTEYRIETPQCPWPPPMVTDTTVQAIPLGCPYMLPDSTVVGTLPGWYLRAP